MVFICLSSIGPLVHPAVACPSDSASMALFLLQPSVEDIQLLSSSYKLWRFVTAADRMVELATNMTNGVRNRSNYVKSLGLGIAFFGGQPHTTDILSGCHWGNDGYTENENGSALTTRCQTNFDRTRPILTAFHVRNLNTTSHGTSCRLAFSLHGFDNHLHKIPGNDYEIERILDGIIFTLSKEDQLYVSFLE